jgi:hypothetical protein
LNDYWDFGYGLGVVISRRENSILEIPKTLSNGNYEIMARILESSVEGTSELRIGNSIFPVRPTIGSSGMQWVDLGSIKVKSKVARLALVNTGGTTAINSLAFVPVRIWRLQSKLLTSNLAKRPTDVIVSCNKGATGLSDVYLPKGEYTTNFIGTSSWLIDSRPLKEEGSLVSRGQDFSVSTSTNGCQSALIFKSRTPSRNKLSVLSTYQNWDPYWTYSSRTSAPKQAFPIDGVLGSGVLEGKQTRFTYTPNKLLSEGILISESSFAITGMVLMIFIYFRRVRRG